MWLPVSRLLQSAAFGSARLLISVLLVSWNGMMLTRLAVISWDVDSRDRLEQVQPKIIFSVDAVVYVAILFSMPAFCLILTKLYRYNHKVHPHLPKLSQLLAGLPNKIPDLKVVVISVLNQPRDRQLWDTDWVGWEDFVKEGRQHKLGRSLSGEIKWNRMAFDAPLWILFSSGTTGRPKWVFANSTVTELSLCESV
jgi:hypothetical protein